MQVSLETTSGLERRMTVGVPAQRIEDEVTKRLQQGAQNVRINGFRPGKVPFKVIRQRYGEGIRREVLGEVMVQTFQEAIVQEKLRPAGQPSIEPTQMETGQDLEYVAVFEVFPEIETRELKSTTVERPVAEVTPADIDNIIEIFRKQQGNLETVERAAADGDTVVIDYLGKKDGEPFEGGSAEGSTLQLGSGRMIPGFEAGIEGMTREEVLRSFIRDKGLLALPAVGVAGAMGSQALSQQDGFDYGALGSVVEENNGQLARLGD